MSPEAEQRLRGVRDCGILRASMGDPGLCELFRAQLVERRYVNGRNAHLCDYRLTESGKIAARRLPSGMVAYAGRKVSNDEHRNPL